MVAQISFFLYSCVGRFWLTKISDLHKGKTMSTEQPKNPLHGVTLEMILTSLVERYGWDELGRRIDIKCFKNDPSLKSSLKFLRKTPWAREKVEELFLRSRKGQEHA